MSLHSPSLSNVRPAGAYNSEPAKECKGPLALLTSHELSHKRCPRFSEAEGHYKRTPWFVGMGATTPSVIMGRVTTEPLVIDRRRSATIGQNFSFFVSSLPTPRRSPCSRRRTSRAALTSAAATAPTSTCT